MLYIRRVHKWKCTRLLSIAVVLYMVMVSWEDLDHHVLSHVKSYTYRSLVNKYDFLKSSFHVAPNSNHQNDGVDGEKYQLLINHPDKCGSGGDGDNVFLLLFVKSSPQNLEPRQAIRETWGNETYLWSELKVNVRVVFVLGVDPDSRQRSQVQTALLLEDKAHGDLIQQHFDDTFHNLTAKLMLQFQWFYHYCPKALFVMSADDDIFVHTPNLIRYLQQVVRSDTGVTDFWVGHVHSGSPPNRRMKSKYYVSRDVYPWISYPDYTAGAGFVVSNDVSKKIYQATLMLKPSIYIDDVFMGICAHIMGVSPQKNAYFLGEGKAHPCIYDDMITSHGHTKDMHALWETVADPAVYSMYQGFFEIVYCTAIRMILLIW